MSTKKRKISMQLKNAKVYKYPKALRLKYLREILLLINKFDIVVSNITDLLAVFSACVDQEELCLQIIRKSNISNKKEEIDNIRDTIIMGINHIIKAGLRHSNKEVREAAQRLKIVFDTYNKPIPLVNMPYDAETVAIYKLLGDLNNNYLKDAQMVGIDDWIIELQKQNEEFDQLAKTYNEEIAQKPVLRLVDLRKETDIAYHELIDFINALIIVNRETSYEQFITEFNVLVKHYNDTMAKHLGRIRSAKDEEYNEED